MASREPLSVRPGEPRADDPFVATGQLPPAADVARIIQEVHADLAGLSEGRNSSVYPALAEVDPALFGICVVSTAGELHCVGDAAVPFTIMSVAKPFVFALVCEAIGPEEARRRIGVNATGRPFNAVAPVLDHDGRTNPMVNSGAIATTSLVPGRTLDQKWDALVTGLSGFAGRRLALDEDVHRSASQTNLRNREIASALAERGLLACGQADALELYTRQSSLRVTARDLAVMGATLADGGVNPVSGERVIDQRLCHHVLAVMATAGLYETSGDWLYEVGLPGKSGIGGGIVTVSPGKGGLGTYSPPLDAAGNSVRGVQVAIRLSSALGMDLFASRAGRPVSA